MKITDYINKHHSGNKSDFARANDVLPQQVTQWVNKGFIVLDGVLYSPRRDLLGKLKADSSGVKNKLKGII